ncbi:hypothetical protein [Thalassotalea sediminis]|uniref:hypothetical protein n=1 Tax=Thalassotalea sediminis TaxID=1759089 RepID=UPI002572CEA7|nr:hypothetical protein [Thalassotalea sediminis]
MIKQLSHLLAYAVIMSFSVVAQAGVISNTATCSTSTGTLDSIHLSDYDISDGLSGGEVGGNLLSQSYNSTSCIGLFDGNDNHIPPLGNNIGEYGDGLLNGATFFNGPYSGDHLSGLEFITLDDLQDVDNDGNDFPGPGIAEGRDDPGWINLGSFDYDDGDLADAETNAGHYNWLNVTELAISDVLRLSFSCNEDCSQLGWTLFTDKDIVGSVQDILGKSTFDHLAFSIKSGNSSDEDSTGGWGVYDFNFKEIFQMEVDNGNAIFGDPNAFTTAFVLGGTLNLGDDFYSTNGQGQKKARGISHLTVYARDPAEALVVTEPSTIGILGISIVLLTLRRKTNK